MKILHLGDLHIGKKVNGFCMLEEQKYVLQEALELIKNEKISSVLISGDVFDKPIPQVFALNLFSQFLSELNKLKIKVFIISGNHDNLERLSYLNELLKSSNIYIAGIFKGEIEHYDIEDGVTIYLMPYLYPLQIKKYFPDSEINSYNDAIKVLIDNTILDKNRVNILLAHQFVSSNKTELQFSDSEQRSLGLLDMVDYKIFQKFDYTALGHIHCPQSAGDKNIRYSGSILKYSFSEINQKKTFSVINIEDKKINMEFFDIKFQHDMKELRGYIDDFLDEKFYSKINRDDYFKFTLLDEEVLDAKKKLSMIYPNIMILEFDNKFTRELNSSYSKNYEKDKTLLEHFCDFYKIQTGEDIDDKKFDIVKSMAEKIERNDCAPD